MEVNCTNTIERIYLKVTNRNAMLYWVDIVHNSDTLTVGIKTEDPGYIYPFTSNGATLVGNKNYYYCSYGKKFVMIPIILPPGLKGLWAVYQIFSCHNFVRRSYD